VKLYTEDVLVEFYEALKNKTLKYLHIPHSDVFYVRIAIEKATGVRYTLEHVEKSMLLEGWKDG
tara:strand:+ start:444 stop:635 length:192 start_codon:yes stop_codon:yes gene_type:complete